MVASSAGTSGRIGNFPVNIAVHPDGKFGAVLHSGYGAHEIIVVDLDKAAVTSRTPVKETFYGLEFSRDGRRLYCSGGADGVIHIFNFADSARDQPAARPECMTRRNGEFRAAWP